MKEYAHFNNIDTLSLLVAALCHDVQHDGFNNRYHVVTKSPINQMYGEQAVQENFHAAESFAILNQTDYNFLEDFSRDDFKTFRQRFTGIILATDMARHTSDLAKMKTIMEKKGIQNGENRALLIDNESHKKEFDSK